MASQLAHHQRLWWIFIVILGALFISTVGYTAAATENSAETTPANPTAPPIPSLSASLAPHTKPTTIIPDQYIVIFQETGRRAAQVRRSTSRLVEQSGGQVNREYERIFNGLAITLASDKALAELEANPDVASVRPNKLFYVTESPQENPTWGLDRIDQVSLPLDAQYGYLGDGSGVHVFIIDTGIFSTHEEFTGRIGVGYDFVNEDDDPHDDHWHGTHVAGTVGGTQYGVAKDVTLHAAKVCSGAGSCPHDVILSAYEWVIGRPERPAVINMSLGGDFDQATNDAIAAAVDAGIVVVVAAGNGAADACEDTPGSAEEAIVVGASNANDALAGFTNYGSCVDLFAPGVGILSARNTGVSDSQTANGTSMASPHVAGAVAIYLEAGYSASEATNAVINTASAGQLTGLIGDSPDKLLYQAVTPFDLVIDSANKASCAPSGTLDLAYALNVYERLPFTGDVILSTAAAPGSTAFSTNPVNTLPATTTLTVTNVATGDHQFAIVGTSVLTPALSVTRTLRHHVAQTVTGTPFQVLPTNTTTNLSRYPTLSWTDVTDVFTYSITIASDPAMSNVVQSATLTDTTYTATALAPNTDYYWRVTAGNGCGESISIVQTFTTRPAQLFVDADANGAATGLSWADAYPELTEALAESADQDTIWVAEGVYQPATAGGDRNAAFAIKDGIAIYGGFTGNENALDERNADAATNGTILSGDLNGDDSGDANLNDNSYSVVVFDIFAGDDTILDGFTISGGNANADGNLGATDTGGGGIYLAYGEPKLQNLLISGNRAATTGAGLSTYGDPILDNVIFSSNIVTDSGTDIELYGGGFFSYYGHPTLRDVTFQSNRVFVNGDDSIASGGGFVQVLGSTTLVNVLFEDNHVSSTNVAFGDATTLGGAFRNLAGAASLVNVTFVGNSAESTNLSLTNSIARGGAMFSSYTNTLLTNVIFSGNYVTATGGLSTESQGAAIYNFGFMTMSNGTLYDNHSTGEGGGVYNGATEGATTPTLDVTNSVFWQNSDTGGSDSSGQVHDTSISSTISYSILQGGWSGTAIVDSDPLFIDPDGIDDAAGTADDDFRGQYNSPMLDAGSNAALPTDSLDVDHDLDTGEQLPLDRALATRLVNTTVDAGAIETQFASVSVTPGNTAVMSMTLVDGLLFSAEIPANSVTETVELVYIGQDTVASTPPSYSFAEQAFTIEAVIGGVIQPDFVFQQPITITLTYNEADLNMMSESTLLLHYYDTDTNSWVDAATSCAPISTYTRTPAADQLSVAICHLTEFGLFGTVAPTAVTTQQITAESTSPTRYLALFAVLTLCSMLLWYRVDNRGARIAN
ncbi:MAG: S8 family serine peptidase [Candidatus Promineifilaceae bacterium]